MKGEFEADKQIGQMAEKMVAAALAAKGNRITDVSGDPEYQWKDIDFVVERREDTTTLEVKNEVKSQRTGNVFLEVSSNGGKGWFRKTEAEHIAFAQTDFGIAHIVSMDDLRQAVAAKQYPIMENRWGTAYGFLFPVSHLKQMGSYYKLQLMEEKENESIC